MQIDHADIVVNHVCNMSCKYCVDKFRGNEGEISFENVCKFLHLLEKHEHVQPKYNSNPKMEILMLGGEPTLIGVSKLALFCGAICGAGFSPIISTNARDKEVVKRILPFFDWVQVAVYSDAEIDYWRKLSTNKINLKLSGDASFSMKKLQHFADYTKDFKRRSVTMFFKPNFEQCCPDKEVQEFLNTLEWERVDSYEYTMYEGVRLKRCIPGITNIADEPHIPKIYPNGNYNKTWLNEDNDPYLGEL